MANLLTDFQSVATALTTMMTSFWNVLVGTEITALILGISVFGAVVGIGLSVIGRLHA